MRNGTGAHKPTSRFHFHAGLTTGRYRFKRASIVLVHETQHRIDDPIVHFRNIAGKSSYTMSLLLRIGYLAICGGAVAVIVDQFAERLLGHGVDWSSVLDTATSSRSMQLALLVAAVVLVRCILIRVSDPDTSTR